MKSERIELLPTDTRFSIASAEIDFNPSEVLSKFKTFLPKRNPPAYCSTTTKENFALTLCRKILSHIAELSLKEVMEYDCSIEELSTDNMRIHELLHSQKEDKKFFETMLNGLNQIFFDAKSSNVKDSTVLIDYAFGQVKYLSDVGIRNLLVMVNPWSSYTSSEFMERHNLKPLKSIKDDMDLGVLYTLPHGGHWYLLIKDEEKTTIIDTRSGKKSDFTKDALNLNIQTPLKAATNYVHGLCGKICIAFSELIKQQHPSEIIKKEHLLEAKDSLIKDKKTFAEFCKNIESLIKEDGCIDYIYTQYSTNSKILGIEYCSLPESEYEAAYAKFVEHYDDSSCFDCCIIL